MLIELFSPWASTSINGLLTSINLTPVSPNSYINHKDRFLNNRFIGTGPYQLATFQPEQQRIIPNNNYWGSAHKRYYFELNENQIIEGCTNQYASNYNEEATIDVESCTYLGDLNGNGEIDVVDVVFLVEIIIYHEPTEYQLQQGDLYPDGILNVVDIIALIESILDF